MNPRRTIQFIRTILPICAALSAPLWADTPAPTPVPTVATTLDGPVPSYTLPEVVVTAPTARLAPNSPYTATILNRGQFAPYAPRTLGEALSPVVGVDVAAYGAAGSMELLSLRGSNTNQVLVLQDGQRLNSAQGGGVDLSTIPLDRVERIEVIRGLAPVRYGVEGLGGVVNIVTSREISGQQAPSFQLEGTSGSFGTYRADGQLDCGLGEGRASLALTGAYGQGAGGYSFTHPITGQVLDRENTDFKQESGGARLTVPTAPGWRQVVDWDVFNQDSGVPGSIFFPTPNARLSTRKDGLQVRSEIAEPLEGDPLSFLDLSLQALFQDLHYINAGLNDTFDDASHHNQAYEARLDSRASLGDRFLLSPSIGFRADHLDSTTDGSRDNRVGYAALEGSWFMGRFPGVRLDQDLAAVLVVTPGVRMEASSLFPAFVAPRLGAVWTWDRKIGLAWKTNFGSQVRYPSFDDLFVPVTGLAAGNPGLKPEHSQSWDLGLVCRPGPFNLALTAFTQSMTDLIQWSPNFAGVWRPLNISSALLQGLELEAAFSPIPLASFLQVEGDASYSALEALDESGQPNVNGMQLIYRPKEKSSMGLTFHLWKDLQLAYRTRFVGYRYLTPTDTGEFIPGFVTHQVGLKVTAGAGIEISATVYNIGGENYYDLNDYPMPGRQWELKTSCLF